MYNKNLKSVFKLNTHSHKHVCEIPSHINFGNLVEGNGEELNNKAVTHAVSYIGKHIDGLQIKGNPNTIHDGGM